MSNRDAFLFAALAMQATHGDYHPAFHSIEWVAQQPLIPERNKRDMLLTLGTMIPSELGFVYLIPHLLFSSLSSAHTCSVFTNVTVPALPYSS